MVLFSPAVRAAGFLRNKPFLMLRHPLLRSMSTGAFNSKIHAENIQVELTSTPKQKPVFDHSLPFGKVFTDHMLEIEWSKQEGFSTPRIVPYHKLQLDPSVPALHYGVQCFEGMKAYKDAQGKVRLFRPELNMKRFHDSCTRLALPDLDEEGMLQSIAKFVRLEEAWVPGVDGCSLYLRPTCIGTTEYLGVAAPSHALIYCIACPVGPYFADGFAPVKVLAETTYKRAFKGGTGDSKVGGNYAPGLLPQQLSSKKGYSQVLWLGEDDAVTEVGAMNLFVFWTTPQGKKQLITAPLDGTILPGVTRNSILELARKWGEFDVSESVYTMQEVQAAVKEGRVIEVFGAGTAAVVAPVNGIGYMDQNLEIPCGPDGKAGALTRRLFDTLSDIHYGRSHEADWSMIV